MIQSGDTLRFALEAGPPLGVPGGSRRKHFDCDFAFQLGIVGTIDLAHPARTKGRLNLVRAEASAGGKGQGGRCTGGAHCSYLGPQTKSGWCRTPIWSPSAFVEIASRSG